MSLINHDAQALIERIRAVNQTLPYSIDLKSIEGAFAAHLKVLRLPIRPLRLIEGHREALLYVFNETKSARGATRDAAWDAAWGAAWDAARDAAWDAARGAARDAAWGAAWDAARDAAWGAAWGAAWDVARDAAWDAAWDAARGAAWDVARDAARGATRDAARDAAWGAMIVNSLQDHPRYQEFCQTWLPFLRAFEAGLFVYWMKKHEIVIVPRPIFRFQEGRLHGDGVPAVEFPNGERYYFWRGVAIPEDWGKVNSEHWKPKWLLETQNAEQRRVLIQGLGYERLKSAFPTTVIHTDCDMELLRLAKDVDVEHIVLLKVVCPSTQRPYVLRVPPQMTTCESARRWTLHDENTQLEFVKET